MNKARINSLEISFLSKKIVLHGFEGEYIFEKIKTSRTFYEIDLLKYLYFLYSDLENIIDVGANIGNHSVFFGCFLSKKVISVEPNSDIYEILEKNLNLNQINYELIKTGISSQKNTAKLFTSYGGDNVGMAKILDVGDESQQFLQIELNTLDNIQKDLDLKKIDLIKLDIEGHEMEALKGAKNILTKFKPDLLIEIASAEQKAKFDNFLSKYGYSPVTVWGSTPMWHYTTKNIWFKLKAKIYWFKFKIKNKFSMNS